MQPQGTHHIRSFVFDTRDQSIKTVDTQQATDFGGQQTRVHEDSNAYWQLDAHYRHQWPAAIFWSLLLVGEAAIVIILRPTERRISSSVSLS